MKLLSELIRTAPLVCCPDPGFRHAVSRAKYCFRGLLFPRLTRAWFDLLEQPKLIPLVHAHPHILSKLQRPYLNRSLGPRKKLDALKQHYLFVTTQFSDLMMKMVSCPQGLALATVRLEEVGDLNLRLFYLDHFEKEGELTLAIVDEGSGSNVYFLTFCVSSFTLDRRELFIGGLQARKHPEDKERIIAITRKMFGLRPKALLFFSVQQLAGFFGITSIRAVSDEMHVYRHFRKRKEIQASYNKFWTECDGRPSRDGMFDLPVLHLERDLSDLKAAKRQMYRRRYAMLRELAAQIRFNLANSIIPSGQGTGQDEVHR